MFSTKSDVDGIDVDGIDVLHEIDVDGEDLPEADFGDDDGDDVEEFEAGADIIAFETIPNKLEAKAFTKLLDEGVVKIPGWFSFNSKDGVNVVSGDSIKDCISIVESCEKVVAVGINCTPPRFIEGLVLEIKSNSLVIELDSMAKLSEECNIQVPMEVLNLIDDGKNPDEFTRDVLNTCIARTQVTKGKTDTFKGLRKHILEKLEQTFPDEVDMYREICVNSAAVSWRFSLHLHQHTKIGRDDNGDKAIFIKEREQGSDAQGIDEGIDEYEQVHKLNLTFDIVYFVS